MPRTRKPKYFVGSNDDAPARIHFSMDTAKEAGHIYIDVFDKDGQPLVGAIKLVDGEYTTEF